MLFFFNICVSSGYVTSRFRPAIDCFRNSPYALDLAVFSGQLKRLFVDAACFITHYCCHNFYCVRQTLIVTELNLQPCAVGAPEIILFVAKMTKKMFINIDATICVCFKYLQWPADLACEMKIDLCTA